MRDTCPGCGTTYPRYVGPVHRYIGASAACWAVYTAILAGAEPDPRLLAGGEAPAFAKASVRPEVAGLEQLVVDAFAAQHHGDRSPRAVQSVAVHLLAMHGVIRRGVEAERVQWVRRRALRRRGVFVPLTPPPLGAAPSPLRCCSPGCAVNVTERAGYVAGVYASWEELS